MMTTTYSAAGGLLLLIVLQRELILAAARPDVENHVRRCGECLEFSKSKDYSACKVWFRILLLICPLLLRCIILLQFEPGFTAGARPGARADRLVRQHREEGA